MTENFTTSSKGLETSKNKEKFSLEFNINSNEYSFRNEHSNIRFIRFSPKLIKNCQNTNII